MVIFNSYVKLPEGISNAYGIDPLGQRASEASTPGRCLALVHHPTPLNLRECWGFLEMGVPQVTMGFTMGFNTENDETKGWNGGTPMLFETSILVKTR